MRRNRRSGRVGVAFGLTLILALGACGGENGSSGEDALAARSDDAGNTVSAFDWPPAGLEDAPSFEPWTGDLPGMAERRVVRFLTVYGPQYYFVDTQGQERGIAYEAAREFGTWLNDRLGRRDFPVHVLVLPVPRDRLIPMLRDGLGDIAAGNVSITPGRLEEVDFSTPTYSGVQTIVVTGPGVVAPSDLGGLAGRQLHVRESTSHWETARAVSDSLVAAGLPAIELVPLPGFLESDQVLEMVSAGTIPMTLMDSHVAEFWEQGLDGLELHPELALATGEEIGWAFRKDSPALAEAVNEFVREHRVGTLMGNIVINRYFESPERLADPMSEEGRGRFADLQALFQRYAGQYDFDWLMVAAQAYQESRLDQSVRSHVGAVGVMQVLPTTAADVGINEIEELEANIHAGVKYLRFLHDEYFADLQLDRRNRHYFAFAAYNAGPNRIRRLRARAEQIGLDPNQWFGNVEVVAAKEVGSEPVRYVSNIAKYYVAYTLHVEHARRAEEVVVPD